MRGRAVSGIIGVVFVVFGIASSLPNLPTLDTTQRSSEKPGETAEQRSAEEALKVEQQKLAAAEEARRAAEQAQRAAEQKAAEAEEARKAAEQKAAQEALRGAEQKAVAAEEARRAAEQALKAAEQKAAAAEEARKAADEARKAAEQKAIAAGEARIRAAEVEARKAGEQETVVNLDAEAKYRQSESKGGDGLSRFKTISNRDINGKDILSSNGMPGFSAPHITECAEKCDILESCLAFVFDRWNKRCYPKSAISTSIINPHSVLGVKHTFELPNVSTETAVILVMHNSRLRGEPTSRGRAANIDVCKEICKHEKRCVAFNFLKLQSTADNCEIYHEPANGYASDSSADIGMKQHIP